MAKPNKNLLRPAANVSQNYLSLIIAIIVLLCLSIIAGFVFAAQQLDAAQRWTFIGLLILFPVFAAGVAIWLILQNLRRLTIRENNSAINWRIMSPENQRRKLNLEIKELAALLAVTPDQFSDLRSAYIVAEDLALRKIEDEEKITLMRHIAIETAEFDAILINENIIKCIEVTFLVTPNISQEKVNAVLRKLDVTKKLFARIRPGTKTVLMLALVTQFNQKAELELRSTLSRKLSATPVDVDIRLFDFENLQKTYTTDN